MSGGRGSKPRRRSGASGRPSGGRAGQSRGSQGGRRDDRQRDSNSSTNQRSGQRRSPDDLGGDVVEGRQAVRELLLIGRRRVREILMTDDIDRAPIIAEILDLAREQRIVVTRLGRRKIDEEAHTEAPQGVIARARSIRPVELENLARSTRTGQPPFLLVLDGITDPGNLGAILRTAEVAGVTGVVLPRHRAARLSPAAVKSAAGAIEHLDFALVGGLPAALMELRKLGFWSIGLDGGADHSVFDLEAADGAIALVLGAEGEGLSRLVGERCDLIVAIPQVGAIESLNVSAAAAVAMFEVVRRRS